MDFLDDKGVEADLVDALLQAIRHVDLLDLAMQALHLRVTQLRTQDLIIELLYTHTHTNFINQILTHKLGAKLCSVLLKIVIHFVIKDG